MNTLEVVTRWFARPVLNRKRIAFALIVAGLTDALQVALGPFGLLVVDQGLDIIATLVISAAIGFHPLLLPTFVIEFIPGPDLLPTWTGCTAAVILLRNREAKQTPPVIDVPSEVTRMSQPGSEIRPAAGSDELNIPPKI